MLYTRKNGRYPAVSMRRWFLTVVVVVIATATSACAQGTGDIDWVIQELELEEGSVVAEIGAGDGSMTLAVARHVGTSGHVYSSEIGADSVQYLRNVVDSASAANVTVIEGHPTQTNFPDECCDALFMRRVYHHFEDPASMNKSIWQALKPGGRVAVIDFAPRGSESSEPGGRTTASHHGVTSGTVVKELQQAGFTLISSGEDSDRDVYVVMRKPADN